MNLPTMRVPAVPAERLVNLPLHRISTADSAEVFSQSVVAARNCGIHEALIRDALERVARENLNGVMRDAACHVLDDTVEYVSAFDDSRAVPIAADYAEEMSDTSSDDPRRVVARNVSEPGYENDDERMGLILLTGTTPVHRRSAAVELLGALKDGAENISSEIIDDLVDALHHGNWRIRATATVILGGTMHDPTCSDELRQRIWTELLLVLVADGSQLVTQVAEQAISGFEDLRQAIIDTCDLDLASA